MKYIKYLSYVLRHKWFVFIECCKLGIPIIGLFHDLSKFYPSEWFPYTNYFYGTDTRGNLFNIAWLKHQHRNPHHWQYWILPKDTGGIKIIEMPLKYRKEMLADWIGTGKAKGYGNDVRKWYGKNRNKIVLGNKTKQWIEREIYTR